MLSASCNADLAKEVVKSKHSSTHRKSHALLCIRSRNNARTADGPCRWKVDTTNSDARTIILPKHGAMWKPLDVVILFCRTLKLTHAMTETNEPPPQNSASHGVVVQRLVRRLDQRDRKIAGLERYVQRLEKTLAFRTLDLESLSKNVRREVEDALCNVRMIPVHGGIKTSRIMEVRDFPANA